jgi:hypothetical protein
MNLELTFRSSEWNKVKISINSWESGTDGMWITKLICMIYAFIECKYMGQIYCASLPKLLDACPCGVRRRYLSNCVQK